MSRQPERQINVLNIDGSPRSSSNAPMDGESVLRLAFDHLPDAMAIYDAQGKYQYLNSAGLRSIGRSLDEVVGHTDGELFPDSDTQWYLPLLHEAIRTRMVQSAECVVECSGGLEHKVTRMVPVLDEQGELRQVLGIIHDFTERKRAEEERDRVFTQSMSLLNIAGFDGYLKRWNPAWEDFLGYGHDEMMALGVQELVHPEDWTTAAENVAKLKAGQDVRGAEARIRCKDGSYKWLLWNAVPCVDQQLYFAAGLDITARKQAEQQLRESQERFQLIAGATKDAVWDWDLRENRIWRNEGYRQAYGVPKDDAESVVEWWRERIHPDDRPHILAQIPPSFVNGRQEWALEYRFRRINGTYAHVYDRGFVVFDDQGSPIRMVGSLMDISELKNTEGQLLESEERFQLAAKATRAAIWDWDLRKGKVWRSEGFQTLFGYAAEAVGCDFGWWEDRIHEDDRDRVLSRVPAPDSADTQQFSNEYRFRRADGSYADVFDRGFVMFNPKGKPVRMIGSMMDISERRRAEEMAHMQQAELAHIARVSTVGEITTGLAHELNQPLTAIANYAESCAQAIASNGSLGDKKLLSWIEQIAVNTHRAGEMIHRLRSFTRKSEPRRSRVEINELIRDVIDLMEAETRLQNIRLRWEPTRPAQTAVDCIQVQQVLVNLLRNAFEATAGQPPERRQVTIGVTASDENIEISVEDLGEGIPRENRQRVFEAFFTSKPDGVGIGLAISRSIIEDHGGRLWLVPNPKHGVTFRFTLPMIGESQDVAIADRVGRG
ncbi:MAG: PAS domain S-box protein [Planctomycetia bacterium]|nr:PAS domain S-box protein [Planctomycetia bacterium]